MGDGVRRDDVVYKVGDDRALAWEIQEADGDALAAGDFTARAQVRPYTGGPLLHEWSTTNERARFTAVPADTPSGPDRWFVELLVDDSRTWDWVSGEYDLYIFDGQGHAQPIVEGRWRNRPAITSSSSTVGT